MRDIARYLATTLQWLVKRKIVWEYLDYCDDPNKWKPLGCIRSG